MTERLKLRRTRLWGWCLLVLLPLCLLSAFFLNLGENDEESLSSDTARAAMNRPQVQLTSGYVGSDACRSCHVHNHATWHASYHRTMTQIPDADNVHADFRDVTLEVDGRSFVLSQEGDDFWVELDDPDALTVQSPPRVKRKIVLMTGSHHEQDFWFETPRGRAVQRLPFVYRLEEQEWYPDVSVLMTPPGSPSGFGQWNLVCIQCHTTLGRPKVDPRTGYAESEVVEFGISCEACHGPGEAHVQRHRSDRDHAKTIARGESGDQIVNPSRLDHRRSAETCGQCHSITLLSDDELAYWVGHGFRFRPGRELDEARVIVQPAVADDEPVLQQRILGEPHFLDDRFWSDGMVRVVGREYNGLIDSPCYLRGEMSCLSCHEMHPSRDDPRPLKEWANDQLRVGMHSDQACLQCHNDVSERLTEHTHHLAQSEGSRCYNCHMPHTTYGLLKAVRSHQIDSPSIAASLSTGRPNACNLCHLDKSLDWADRHLADWYGLKRSQLTSRQQGVPASIIWGLQGDAGQRALIAWGMAWKPAQDASGTDWQGRILAPLLDDPYDVVRFIANRSLRTLPGFDAFEYSFISPPNVRRDASRQALEQWKAMRSQAGQSTDLSELIKVDSSQSAAEILENLLRNRDDRRVELAE